MSDEREDSTPSAQQPPPDDEGGVVNPLLQKYEEYRTALAANPQDFQTWTYLLGTVERLDEMPKIVEVFDAFLSEYPLCYGYWKKYADAALKHLGLAAAAELYERGLAGVAYSVDLWAHFLTFHMTKAQETPDVIRRVFERGLVFVGTDFLCHILWDKYFQYEKDQGQMQNVAQLFRRVLSVPCKELEAYHGKFAAFAAEHELQEVMTASEAEAYRQDLQEKRSEKKPKGEEVDGDVQMQENGTPKLSEAMSVDLLEADSSEPPSDAAVKEFWIQSMTELYNATAKQLAIRRQYEDCIKRPYFHVKPLDNIQLQAWWKYLDAVSSEGDHRETVILFERCLVACASYPEFWMRYALYMETMDVSEAMNVTARAVQVFCKNKSEMHLFAGHFYERREEVQKARSAFEHVTSTLAPTLLNGIIQHASFEYRNNGAETANQLYESKIQGELETEGSDNVGFLAIQYAYIQIKRFGAKEKAREVVDQVLEARQGLLSIWEGAIQLEEIISDDDSVQRVISLYKKCTSQQEKEGEKVLTVQERCSMSTRLLHFLDFHGETELYGQMHRQHLERFGLYSIAPSLHRKRAETTQEESTAPKTTQGEGTASAGETKTEASNLISTTISEYFAQNPAAQQYAQYYQYAAAAAAAAGYGNYAGYGGSTYTG